jgi:hypothetical protein
VYLAPQQKKKKTKKKVKTHESAKERPKKKKGNKQTNPTKPIKKRNQARKNASILCPQVLRCTRCSIEVERQNEKKRKGREGGRKDECQPKY